MYLKSIKLKNFRNYKQQSIELSRHINIFLGNNAQGKTNLMEAIHVLSLTKSYRTTQDKELINWTNEFSLIEGIIYKNNNYFPLKIIIHSKGKKVIIGKIEQKKLSDYIGHLLVVTFSPEDLDIIKGSPSYRRRFLDMQIGQINQVYLKQLMIYQKILKQRNNYLKNTIIDDMYLDILTEQLAKQSAFLLYHRLSYLKNLHYYANKKNLVISNQLDELTYQYISQIECNETDTVESLYNKYMIFAQKIKEQEKKNKISVFGIHRDDIVFFINEKNVHQFGSQGQQRTVILSLKLAEIDVIFKKIGDYPILLLDDVLSELDDDRQTFLLKSVENKIQTIMTTTNLDGIKHHLIEKPQIFYIKEGSVVFDD